MRSKFGWERIVPREIRDDANFDVDGYLKRSLKYAAARQGFAPAGEVSLDWHEVTEDEATRGHPSICAGDWRVYAVMEVEDAEWCG